MIESDLEEAKIALREAENSDFDLEQIKKVLLLSSRALLVVKGVDSKDEEETFLQFGEKFINGHIVSQEFSNLKEVFLTLKAKLSPEERKDKFYYAQRLWRHMSQLYKSMDSSLNFPQQRREQTKSEGLGVLDLRGTPCPINYVKAKLYLENLDSGDIVVISLDPGEPMQIVPKCLRDDGHKILKVEKYDSFYKVEVEKG